METAPWHILGAGAIGCLFAHALHRSGGKPILVMRAGRTEKSLPLTIERDGERDTTRLDAITPDDDASISRLLVATKAQDVRDAVAGIAHLISDDGVVVVLSNGLGFVEQVVADWPRLDIYPATTTEGAYRIDAQRVCHAGRGETRFGRTGWQSPPTWFADWKHALQNCLWDEHISSALWAKLAVNCIVNPLTALHGCLNGELGRRDDLAAEVTLLCGEIAHISRAAGFVDIAGQLPELVARVIAGTAGNRSSMLQDVQSGRPTEIDFITGYLLQVAERHHIDAPHNRALLERIKTLGY